MRQAGGASAVWQLCFLATCEGASPDQVTEGYFSHGSRQVQGRVRENLPFVKQGVTPVEVQCAILAAFDPMLEMGPSIADLAATLVDGCIVRRVSDGRGLVRLLLCAGVLRDTWLGGLHAINLAGMAVHRDPNEWPTLVRHLRR